MHLNRCISLAAQASGISIQVQPNKGGYSDGVKRYDLRREDVVKKTHHHKTIAIERMDFCPSDPYN
jgi:hypothetical protein